MKEKNGENTSLAARPRLGSQFCKRILAVLASSFLVLTAWCASGTWKDRYGATWTFDYSGTFATVRGASGYWSTVIVPEKVYVGTTPYVVIEIGDKTFDATVDAKASTIGSVIIPSSVQTIGERAFYGCSSLAYAVFDHGLWMIKANAFQNAVNLQRIVIPKSVEVIEDGAFSGCSALEGVEFAGPIEDIYCDDMYSDPVHAAAVFAGTPFLAAVNVNDKLSGAIGIGGKEGRMKACNILATLETGEPTTVDGEAIGKTLWWAWTAPAGVNKVSFYTYGSSFDTSMGVYTGTKFPLTKVIENDDRSSSLSSFVSFTVKPNTTYYICVGGSWSSSGTINLAWEATSDPFSLVIVDDTVIGFAGLCPESVTIPDSVTNIEASAFSHSVDTSVSSLKSVVIPESVVMIGDYAFYGCFNLSSVTFENVEVPVDMDIDMAFGLTPYLTSLGGNDDFADAVELTGRSGSAMGWNRDASTETGEPVDTENRSLWWKWKPPAGVKKAVFHTYGSDFDTVLGVYEGPAVDALSGVYNDQADVGWSENADASWVEIDVAPGVEYYYICVGSSDPTEFGTVKLGWEACGSGEFSLVTWGETLLGPVGTCPASVVVPDGITLIEQSAFDHDFFASVANLKSVFIPESVAKIAEYAFYECSQLASVTFEDDALLIDMDPLYAFRYTPFLAEVNKNDAWADAIELTGAKGSVSAWNAFATPEVDEPQVDAVHTLWWKWKPPAGVKKAVFHTYGSSFDTLLGVYTGTAVDALTEVALNDDRGGGSSFVSFDVSSSETYYICVSGYRDDKGGDVKLTWEAANEFSLIIEDGVVIGFLGECPASLTIPNTVTMIGESAFDYDCDPSAAKITSLVIPGSVTNIGYSAFSECDHLTSVTFNEGLRMIDDTAFWGCVGLAGQTFTLPTTLEEIGEDAFRNLGGELTLILPRSLNGMLTSGPVGTTDLTVRYYVKATLDPNGGTLAAKDRVRMLTGDTFGNLAPLPTRTGYTFKGWKLGTKAITATTALPDVATLTLTAQWAIIKKKVTLDLGGGTGTESLTVNYGTKVGNLPRPTRENYTFVGWFTAATGGVEVSANTPITADLKLYAQWKALYFLYADASGEVPQTAASKYEGYLYNEKGKAVGSVEVKLSKPKKNKKLPGTPLTTKPTITIVLPGAGKTVIKGTDVLAGSIEMEVTVGTRVLNLKVGENGLAGTFGEFGIEGARNLFTSKDKSEVAAANAVLDKWRGAICLVTDTGEFSIALSAKGKAKLAGTVNGKKLSGVKGQLLVGEEWCCLPLIWSKGGTSGSYTLWLKNDGSLASVAESETALVGKPGTLASGAQFVIDDVPALVGLVPGMFTDLLPTNVAVKAVGTKWTLPKAGKVAYKRGTTEIDATKLGDNPSALKLTYKAKDGSFKGSFKVYANNAGRLKATSVNVTGVVIDGVGYGTAAIKGVSGSIPVTVK